MKRSSVFKLILAMTAVIAAIDLWLLNDGIRGNTYSSVLQKQIWTHGLLAFIAVHIARPPESKQIKIKHVNPWIVTTSGAIIASVGGGLLGGGFYALALGATSAFLFWGNSGQT